MAVPAPPLRPARDADPGPPVRHRPGHLPVFPVPQTERPPGCDDHCLLGRRRHLPPHVALYDAGVENATTLRPQKFAGRPMKRVCAAAPAVTVELCQCLTQTRTATTRKVTKNEQPSRP